MAKGTGLTAPLEIMVQNDGFLALLVDAMDGAPDRIQGFLYGGHHVIRDVFKPWDQQEIWRRSGEYEATHAAMMRQIEIEKLRIAVQRAFSMVANPWPGQEADAAQVRAALAERGGAVPSPTSPVAKDERHGEG